MYQNFDTGGQEKKRGWMPWALGIVCILFLVVLGLAIYFATDTGGSNSASSTCTTEACVELAKDILSSIDEFSEIYFVFCF